MALSQGKRLDGVLALNCEPRAATAEVGLVLGAGEGLEIGGEP